MTVEEVSKEILDSLEKAAAKLPKKDRSKFYKAALSWLWGASSSIGLDGKRH
jgi:hypothetical protein